MKATANLCYDFIHKRSTYFKRDFVMHYKKVCPQNEKNFKVGNCGEKVKSKVWTHDRKGFLSSSRALIWDTEQMLTS